MTIVFDPEKHEYSFGGARVPSVTHILRDLYDFSRVSPEVLAAKGELGTAVHIACELDDANDLVEESVAAPIVPYLEAYRLFKRQKCTEVIATEQIVYNPIYGYAGKFDLVTQFDGARWLIDWKTPLHINPAAALQTAAYAHAILGDPMPERRAALQLLPTGKYKLHEFADPNDWPVFVAMLTAFRWKERNLK